MKKIADFFGRSNRFRRQLILIGLVGLTLPALWWGKYWWDKLETERISRQLDAESRAQSLFIQAAEKISNWYFMAKLPVGLEAEKIKCDQNLGASIVEGSAYLKCNPHYLECLFNNMRNDEGKVVMTLKQKGRKQQVRVDPIGPYLDRYAGLRRHYKLVSKSLYSKGHIPDFGYLLSLSLESGEEAYRFQFHLQGNCEEAYLPQRIYSTHRTSHKLWEWDNFKGHIFMDRYLVTFRDIVDWIDFSRPTQRPIVPKDPAQWKKPADNLTMVQMRSYCAFRGKQVMQAHIYDAATYLPARIENPRPKRQHLFAYPWTTRRTQSFLYRAQKDRNFKLNRDHCRQVYVRGCENILPLSSYEGLNSSWTGLLNVLGGYPEAFDNPLRPKHNLRISSYLLNVTSPLHQLGKRVYWDGKARAKENFDWGKLNSEDSDLLNTAVEKEEMKIAFRCMRFVKESQ